jgi:hypothetical protein
MREIELWRLIVWAVSLICGLALMAVIGLTFRGQGIPSELTALVMSGLTGLLGIFKGPREDYNPGLNEVNR